MKKPRKEKRGKRRGKEGISDFGLRIAKTMIIASAAKQIDETLLQLISKELLEAKPSIYREQVT
jgi:hypothetical protein